MPISATILPEFDQEIANTRKLLECVPDGDFEYRPHPKSMTLGRLATHVAELPGWAAMTLDREVFDLQPGFQPRCAGSRAELLETLDKSAAEAREKIGGATDEEWGKMWTFKYGGETKMSMPRTAVMRSVVMNHLVHHRAQLGVYLRLKDVTIPGMYGPSADESM
jgi:uncharacterized damage-inducible protein DinB